ncbi:hypothetical protein JOM56_012995 [Amanita muscaria]
MAYQGTKKLIIRGQVVEITDDEDNTDVDDSPTPLLAPPLTQQTKPEILQALNPQPSQANQLSVVAISGSSEAAPIWPAYTNLLRGQRDVTLNVQNFELKMIVRKAMDLVEERVRFQNAFPPLVTRTVWNRTALVEACSILCAMSQYAPTRDKYETFKERLRVDAECIGELSKTLLDPRISILRGDSKLSAINNARMAYNLRDGCAPRVQELLTSARYIYPPCANGVGFQYQKPFENSAVVGTLRDELFTKNTSVLPSNILTSSG